MLLCRLFGKVVCYVSSLIAVIVVLSSYSLAQGTWTSLKTLAPEYNGGVMLLLTDGTVFVKNIAGSADMYGSGWSILTPDAHGSYLNATWKEAAYMHDSRLYFSSQVLMDGRVYVAGGEYGTGRTTAEVYDPLSDRWKYTGPIPAGDTIYDKTSEMLPDGRVLQAIGFDAVYSWHNANLIYDPATNIFTYGPNTLGGHGEVSWVKLADNSILFIDDADTVSERYIPSMNNWIKDGNVPVNIYDSFIYEIGPAVLLPNGNVFQVGGNGKSVLYTPSGTTSPGKWRLGPALPDGQGAPDATASVATDGTVLCATSQAPFAPMWFPDPMSFYEYNYTSNSFKQINGPNGLDTVSGPCFFTHMLNLPDGNILLSLYNSKQYYLYTPPGKPLAVGKPTLDSVIKLTCDTLMATGMLFNGITQGSYYGDDWQMSTNYPIVRLTKGINVYYARSYNWNSTGVMRGAQKDTTYFSLPEDLPEGTYTVEIVTNGNPSLSKQLKTCNKVGVTELEIGDMSNISAYPNPSDGIIAITFNSLHGGKYIIKVQNIIGQTVLAEVNEAHRGDNRHTVDLSMQPKGMYLITITGNEQVYSTKLVLE